MGVNKGGWRVSETMGNVEKLGTTSHAWFMESMFQFSGGNVWKLPMDHTLTLTLTISIREDGYHIDKISLFTSFIAPED